MKGPATVMNLWRDSSVCPKAAGPPFGRKPWETHCCGSRVGARFVSCFRRGTHATEGGPY